MNDTTHGPQGRYLLPEFVERDASGITRHDPYSKLMTEGIVFIGAPLDDTVASDVIAQLMHLEHSRPDRDIQIYLNSPGGSETAAFAIHDALEYVQPDIMTVCLGAAGGPAAMLLACGTRGKRLVLPGARLHLTQPGARFEGPVSDLEAGAAEMARTVERLESVLARHTGRSPEQIHDLLDRERFLGAAEAIELGFADRLTVSRKGTMPRRMGIR